MADNDAPPPLTSHTIFVLPIPTTLHLPASIFPTLRTAVSTSTQSILILVTSPIFDAYSHSRRTLSHTQSWDKVQNILAPLYVEATHEATVRDRVLLDVEVLLRGVEDEVGLVKDREWGRVWVPEGYNLPQNLPTWIHDLPTTTFSLTYSDPELATRDTDTQPESNDETLPSEFPVVALGGTFDHLHSGHKILLGMAAWIASKKIIVGITDDALLKNKSNKHVLEPLATRTSRVRAFLSRFKPGLVYDLVAIDDVYGPTGWDPDIQALVVSKETVSGATAIAKHRVSKSLPPLTCFVIDVISATSAKVPEGDMEVLRSAKMSSTFVREWIVKKEQEQERTKGREDAETR